MIRSLWEKAHRYAHTNLLYKRDSSTLGFEYLHNCTKLKGNMYVLLMKSQNHTEKSEPQSPGFPDTVQRKERIAQQPAMGYLWTLHR